MLEQAAQPVKFISAPMAQAQMQEQSVPPSASVFDELAEVHALYEARIFRFFLFSLRDRDAALSLTQDTFVSAWRSRASFRGECSPVTWLMRIAVNLMRNHTRTGAFKFWKRAAETAIEVDDPKMQFTHPGASAESALMARQQLAQVWASVNELSGRQRTIFLLRFVEELELNEIAVATGLSLPTVKSHLYRALDHVRAAQGAAKGGKR